MALNYPRMQRIVDRQIKNFGGGANNAALRRGGVDRPCSAVILAFSNAERPDRRQHRPWQGQLVQWTDKRVLISAVGLDVPPDYELDTFVQNGVEYKIVMPATPLAPDGSTVLYWELVVRR